MNTDWKFEIGVLFESKEWDKLINILENIISESSDNLDAVLNLNYVLIHILVEENYDDSEENRLIALIKQSFPESYSKFSNDMQYLFFTGITCHISEWYFDIDILEAKGMIEKSYESDPQNIIFEWGYYAFVENQNNDKIIQSSRNFLDDSSAMNFLQDKSILGKYVADIIEYWSR